MLCHLRVNETPDMEALLKTQQVKEVLERRAPSARDAYEYYTHIQAYHSPSPWISISLAFTLIDCFHPAITSWFDHFHTLLLSLTSFILCWISFSFSIYSHLSQPSLSILLSHNTFHSSCILPSSSLSFSWPRLYLSTLELHTLPLSFPLPFLLFSFGFFHLSPCLSPCSRCGHKGQVSSMNKL